MNVVTSGGQPFRCRCIRVTPDIVVSPLTPSFESCLLKAARKSAKNTVARLKKTAKLSCIIVGVPTMTLTWEKENESIPSTMIVLGQNGSARLVLSPFNEESARRYLCLALNNGGPCKCSYTLI